MSQAEKAIPRIIHQIWNTVDIPDEWLDCVGSWRECHRDWEYRLWTADDSRRFIREYYSDFLGTFDSYSYNIQRADAVRYFILHKYGGLYVDLDFECLQSVDDILSNRTFVIGREPRKHGYWLGEDDSIANGFMASVPGHSVLVRIIEKMKSQNPRIVTHKEVLTSTGPIMVKNVLRRYTERDVFVLDDYVLYPFTSDSEELDRLVNKKEGYLALKEKCIESGTYAIHYWASSWGANLAGALVNPEPFAVQGYTFFPGLDSTGYDIRNGGRDIESLAAECSRDYRALGFNTDGFVKYYIRPRSEWTEVENRNGNEGLYIKKCIHVN